MELVAGDALRDRFAVGPGEFAAGGVGVLVQCGLDGRSGAGPGRRDRLDQYFVAGQGSAAQAVGNAGEQAVFDLVPFRCPGPMPLFDY